MENQAANSENMKNENNDGLLVEILLIFIVINLVLIYY